MEADTEYLDPYRQAVETHGAGFEATLWGTRKAQCARFDIMIDFLGLDGAVILDVGCGHGDFAAHLGERGVAYDSFIGVDALPEVVAAANDRAMPRCRFETLDPVLQPASLKTYEADIVCFSGTLNTMDDPTARALVEAGFEAASRAVAFNFLSNRCHERWGDRDLTPARRFDTVNWLDWAMSRTSRVAFTQAYLDGHDATIVLWHD